MRVGGGWLKRIYGRWLGSGVINALRRVSNTARIGLMSRLGLNHAHRKKLHLGCGDVKLQDYINIDHRKTHATDVVLDVKKLPYPDNAISEIVTFHVIEHLLRHEVSVALSEWKRVLTPGGRLIIECPDFDQAVREYLAGNEARLDNIFGLQRFAGDAHHFGYNVRRLTALLERMGFRHIRSQKATDYHVAAEPCIRIECEK